MHHDVMLVRAGLAWRTARDCRRRPTTRRRIGSERAPATYSDPSRTRASGMRCLLRCRHESFEACDTPIGSWPWHRSQCRASCGTRRRPRQGFRLFEIGDAGIAAVACCLSWRRILARDMTLQHLREAFGIGWITGFNDDVEHKSAAACGQLELVAIVNVTATLNENIGMRLAYAAQLFTGRQCLTPEDTTFGLIDDALDQRQILFGFVAQGHSLDAATRKKMLRRKP